MAEIAAASFTFQNGYFPSAPRYGRGSIAASIAAGRNVWVLGRGLLKSNKGLGAATGTGGARLYPVGSQVGALSAGSVVAFRGGTRWFVGSGNVTVEGASIGIASNQLQYNSGTGAKPAGLTAPDAAVVAEGATSTIMSGSYSVVLTRINTLTGAESNGSFPSQVIAVKSKRLKLTFPSTAGGQDAWGVYVTRRGQGSSGPHFLLMDVMESSLQARTLELEYYDSQLQATQHPTDHDPPPTATHVCSLGAHLILLGSFPGNGIAAGISPSVAGKAEAYPPTYTVFLSPLESVNGFASREGETVVWTNNSLQALVQTGSSRFPILARPIWGRTGIQSPSGACFADAILYAYTGLAGCVRLGGEEPDSSFAAPVREAIKGEGWNPATVITAWDSERDAVIYCGSGRNGTLAFVFMRGEGIWSTPFELPSLPEAAVTINGRLKLSIGGTLYDWESGTGGNWWLIPAYQYGPDPFFKKTLLGYRAITNSENLTIEALVDFSSTAVDSQTSTGSGQRMSAWKRINKRCNLFTFQCSGTAAEEEVAEIEATYVYEGGIRE